MKATEQVLQEYEKGDASHREMLERIFGKEEFLKTDDAMELFKSFCSQNDLDPLSILPYAEPKNRDQRRTNAFEMLMVMVDKRRKDYLPDFNNANEKKWWPIFDMKNSGFVFVGSGCGWTHTNANGGSRLCLPTEKESDAFGRECLPVWREFLGR